MHNNSPQSDAPTNGNINSQMAIQFAKKKTQTERQQIDRNLRLRESPTCKPTNNKLNKLQWR